MCRRTSRVVACTLVDRGGQSAFRLREAIPKDYRRRATLGDLRDPRDIAFAAGTHRCGGKEQGQTNRVERWYTEG